LFRKFHGPPPLLVRPSGGALFKESDSSPDMCCGETGKQTIAEIWNEATSKTSGIAQIERPIEQDVFIAAGIFRGEGYVGCHLNRRETSYGRHPELLAGVTMCDRDSVEIVARVFGSKVYRNGGGKCAGGDYAWQTRIFGVNRVKDKIWGWVAKELLRGEKADQYFEALAKCGRARLIFLKEGLGMGRPRQIF